MMGSVVNEEFSGAMFGGASSIAVQISGLWRCVAVLKGRVTRPASSRGIWWCSRWLWASRGQCQEGREVPQHWSTWTRQRLATRTRDQSSFNCRGKTESGSQFRLQYVHRLSAKSWNPQLELEAGTSKSTARSVTLSILTTESPGSLHGNWAVIVVAATAMTAMTAMTWLAISLISLRVGRHSWGLQCLMFTAGSQVYESWVACHCQTAVTVDYPGIRGERIQERSWTIRIFLYRSI